MLEKVKHIDLGMINESSVELQIQWNISRALNSLSFVMRLTLVFTFIKHLFDQKN